MGSLGPIAGAETALTRDFGRHVFEIAALLRVSQRLYNYRVCVVEVIGIEPLTPFGMADIIRSKVFWPRPISAVAGT